MGLKWQTKHPHIFLTKNKDKTKPKKSSFQNEVKFLNCNWKRWCCSLVGQFNSDIARLANYIHSEVKFPNYNWQHTFWLANYNSVFIDYNSKGMGSTQTCSSNRVLQWLRNGLPRPPWHRPLPFDQMISNINPKNTSNWSINWVPRFFLHKTQWSGLSNIDSYAYHTNVSENKIMVKKMVNGIFSL